MSRLFRFAGPLPPSKSILIRYLLLRGYAPQLVLPPLSGCADVRVMQAAMSQLATASVGSSAVVELDCGEAGLVLRLLLAYAARRGGRFVLHGSPRLLARPHTPLLQALHELGSEISLNESGAALHLHSPQGFVPPRRPLSLVGGSSSQFGSALLLNAWQLPFAVDLDLGDEPVSAGYLGISLHVAEGLGMHIDRQAGGRLHIAAGQVLQPQPLLAEADVSSALAVAALAAVAGQAHITNFPRHSLQPDAGFVEIMAKMGIPLQLADDGLHVEAVAPGDLRPLCENVAGCPDVVPVLAVLCGLAAGESTLYGAPHLRGKESDRIAETAALLRLLGREVSERDDGLRIAGQPISAADRERRVAFDAGRDHRLVMAAAVARWAGFAIEIHGQQAVDKSFPEFRQIAL